MIRPRVSFISLFRSNQSLFSILIHFKVYQFIRAVRLLFIPSFRKLFLKARRSDICFDFGANVGDAALVLWLRGCSKIYAFEPHPAAFSSLNLYCKNITTMTLVNSAVSNVDGTFPLYLSASLSAAPSQQELIDFSQSSSLLSSKANVKKEYMISVSALSIDTIIKSYGIPNLIKCDIEGGEYNIYKSMSLLSLESNVRHIFIECHSNNNPAFHALHKQMVEHFHLHANITKISLDWH